MKISKKLLAALLPITATATVAPVLTSCNKGSYDIEFGSNVNCLDNKAKDYHSMNDVKNSVKKHAERYQAKTIKSSDVPAAAFDTASELEKQALYYDLIASHSLINTKNFKLEWASKAEDNVVLNMGEEYKGTWSTIMYVQETDKTISIQLGTYKTKSYRFQHTTIVD